MNDIEIIKKICNEKITIIDKMIQGFIAYGSTTDIIYAIGIFGNRNLNQMFSENNSFKLSEEEVKIFGTTFLKINVGNIIIFYDHSYYFVAKVLTNNFFEIRFEILTRIKLFSEATFNWRMSLSENKDTIIKIIGINENLLCECYAITFKNQTKITRF